MPTSSGRTSIVPSPRPVEITGCPPLQDPRRDDVGAVGDQQHPAGDRAGVDDPADQPSGARTGMPIRTPSLVPTERTAKRRGLSNEEPTTRPAATASRLRSRSCSAAFSCWFSSRMAARLDHPPHQRRALALELAVLVGRIPIIAGAADQPGDGGRRPR